MKKTPCKNCKSKLPKEDKIKQTEQPEVKLKKLEAEFLDNISAKDEISNQEVNILTIMYNKLFNTVVKACYGCPQQIKNIIAKLTEERNKL